MTLEQVLSDYTLQIVSLGACLLGIISGVLGSFAVLRKQSLLGDAISHAALPGIAVTFIITQTKNTEILLLGALISGLLATGLIILIDRYTRIKYDSVLGLILSVFFGIGLVLLTYIQKIPNANQAGLDKFIFGQASTLLRRDVYLILGVGSLLLILIVLFWKEFKLLSFDPDFGASLGFSMKKINFLLSAMIVLAIIIGLQTVGVILMSALLVAPGVAARQWTNRLSYMIVIAAFIGAVSGVIGTIMSSTIEKMPTGPSIVLIVSVMVLISIGFAPNRGLLWQQIRSYKNRKEISSDQVLLSLYQLYLNHEDEEHGHPPVVIKPMKCKGDVPSKSFEQVLKDLKAKGYIQENYFGKWSITASGIRVIENHPMKGGL